MIKILQMRHNRPFGRFVALVIGSAAFIIVFSV